VKTKIVPSSWLHRDDRRFDAGPYTSGALEAKVRIEEIQGPKDRLISLTSGYNGGIFNGPQFSRNWVDDIEHGVPFLGSSSMLLADLAELPLLRKRDSESPKLAYLRISVGTTLISCSGTIGRMVYVRPDMDGMWTSQDIMKVVPDPSRVPAGYIYAFLSGKFGRPLVTSGTYGAIIQHIEPEHIADLPVPRLGAALEGEVDALVKRAADARSKAAELLGRAQEMIRGLFPSQGKTGRHLWSQVSSSRLQSRLDAYYYSDDCATARRSFDEASRDRRKLGEVADISIPGIFKRRYADDSKFGVPYITGGDVFEIAPTSERYLMMSVADRYGLTVSKGTILIQEAGQLGGLIGRSVLVGEYLDGFAVSNNMVRLISRSEEDTGYLLALLSTPEGVRLVSREAAGSSIPHLEVNRVRDIEIPWPSQEFRCKVGAEVVQAQEMRDRACVDEARARTLVEDAIESH
jgi:type I restriction enzyme S subunit